MQKENFVSLWLGNMKSIHLGKYLTIKYTGDGDAIPSNFARDFNIRRYDDDFRETYVYEEPKHNIDELLEGFSYDAVIIQYFKGLLGEDLSKSYNTVVLLYNFEYNGLGTEVNDNTKCLKFIGSTKYKET